MYQYKYLVKFYYALLLYRPSYVFSALVLLLPSIAIIIIAFLDLNARVLFTLRGAVYPYVRDVSRVHDLSTKAPDGQFERRVQEDTRRGEHQVETLRAKCPGTRSLT